MDLSVVACAGIKYFRDHLCKICGFTKEEPTMLARWVPGAGKSKAPYRYYIGPPYYPNVMQFMDGVRVGVLHWMGSDVVRAVKGGHPYKDLPNVFHWCVAENLRDELKEIGVNAEVVPIEPPNIISVRPRGASVLIYVPLDGKFWDLYMGDLMLEVQKRSGRDCIWLPPNEGHYEADMEKAINDSGVYLRFLKHDGFSFLAAEMIMAGRPVLTNQDRPFQMKLPNDADEICKHLDIQLDPKAPEWYREYTYRSQVTGRWMSLIARAEHGVDPKRWKDTLTAESLILRGNERGTR